MAGGEDEAYQRFKSRSASGGLNRRVFPLDINDDQAVQLQNIDTSTPGQRIIRGGSELAATGMTYGPILAMSEFTPPTGDTVVLAVAPGASAGDHHRLWEWDGTGSVFTQIGTLTGYTGSHDNVNIVKGWDADVADGHVAMVTTDVEGIDRWYYDGSVLAQAHYGSADPKGDVFSFTNGRAFAGFAVDGADRNRLCFSLLSQWTTTGMSATTRNIPMGSGTTQRIVAAEGFRKQELIVFLQDRLEELVLADSSMFFNIGQVTSPYDDWSRESIDTTIGCGSRKSVVSSGKDILFADQYGNIRSVARTITDASQGVDSLPISEGIHEYIKRVNPAQISKIVATRFDRWAMFGFPLDEATDPDHMFVLDTVRGVWDGPWTNLNPKSMCVATLQGAADSEDKQPTLYIGTTATSEGTVLKYPRGTVDPGTEPVVFQEVTKRISFDELSLTKDFEFLEVWAIGSGSVTMQIEVNPEARGFQHLDYLSLLGDTPVLPQNLTFALGGAGIVVGKFPLDVHAYAKIQDIQFQFTVTADTAVKFLGYQVLGYMDNWDRDVDPE